MKKIIIILSICVIILGAISCNKPQPLPINFKDVQKYSILDYIVQHKDQYSSFLKILEVGKLDKTLSAYNPNGNGYTLFLPDNAAIDSFIVKSGTYSSLDAMLNDESFVWNFCRYHVVNKMIDANDFPFGALSDLTLSKDYLAVSFVIEPDTAYYKINNQAPVTKTNIEMSNGMIHLIKVALTPVTATAFSWLNANAGYTIFRDAVTATGFDVLLNQNPKIDENALPFTLFIEPDSVYHKAGISSFDQLTQIISPGRTDYTDKLNPLYNFVGYHVLTDHMFLNDFSELSTNYSTYSDIPVHVDGTGIDIKINKGKQMFDTIIHSVGDTTFINWVGINYDASNVVTQSGVIHIIDQVMKQVPPSRAIQTYDVYERPYFDEFSREPGTYLIEDSTKLKNIRYTGGDLSYVKVTTDASARIWNDDYITIEGDFTVSYTIPKLVQGSYKVFLQADAYNSNNAVVEIFIDGKPIGGSKDLANAASSSAATANDPFVALELGSMNFVKYEAHIVTVKALIPGSFSWDFVRFEPL